MMQPKLIIAAPAKVVLIACLVYLAAASVSIDSPVMKEIIADREFMYQEPPFATSSTPKGMLVLFHGCHHDAGTFFACEGGCVGLPEERTIVLEAHANRLTTLAISSRGICWAPIDASPAVGIIQDMRKRLGLSDLPLFGLGISSGGSFLSKDLLPQLGPMSMSAASLQISNAGLRILPAVLPAFEFVTMPRDQALEGAVSSTVSILKEKGVSVKKRSCFPLSLTAPYFFAERTRFAYKPVTEVQSAAIVATLKEGGLLDSEGFLLFDPARHKDWMEALLGVPVLSDLGMGDNDSALGQVMSVAFGQHKSCATDIEATFRFFWANVEGRKQTNISGATPPPIDHHASSSQ